ncbi:hypothetical protein PVAND_012682 [Polypedilum vanderplanki]|uniref:Uncharacterized protein n=1 Tax=Polypedilum vanderplanki TaxID=319348 RepID=A0A9J6CN56_POLVA|nr:hypothetical protein PVAND_012682 [Polypedilum vanderplanki]
MSEETQIQRKSKIPKSIPFILVNVFLERYCTAGVLAILPLFLHIKMGFDKNTSTAIFHMFEGMTFLFTVGGAVLADMSVGLYKSIVIMSSVYIVGFTVMTLAMIDPLNLPNEILVPIALTIMVIGCGCIKGNINVFGGNQHKLPEQERQLQIYFSAQYFSLKCGSLLARFTFPILREEVKCFGSNNCFSLVFGIPMVIMIFALTAFLCGSSYYTHVPANGNVLIKLFKCIKHALIQKKIQKRENSTSEKQHWLNYSIDKYGKKLVLETKMTLKVLVIFIPVPMFWALHMQQSSRWIFQASQMNGDIGFYKIKPDQMIVFNSVLVLILIPLFERLVYPLMEKIGIKSMLQRMICGNICTIIAFIVSAIVETQVQKNYISMLWQLPQFFIIAMAEIFTYLATLNFAYKEAPASMKPVIISFMYLTIASGDFIVALISGTRIFESQVYEYLFFAFLMSLDVALLAYLANNYQYTDHEMIKSLDEEEKINKNSEDVNNKV